MIQAAFQDCSLLQNQEKPLKEFKEAGDMHRVSL
jgi:hypothetical protein